MTVYLVGAGPGDPDLLTLRAARLIARADVVVVDRLVDDRVRALISPGVEVIDVGKRPWGRGASWSQDAINELIVERGRHGQHVVRLKGGDPFLFGRGGEEVAALVDAGVDVEVVPGVSSSLALPALAGVPVTHRGVSSTVMVASGHDVDLSTWHSLGALGGTIVLMMAVENRATIARALMDGGREPTTPVLAIERGATLLERRVRTTLEDLGDVELCAPSVIVVGEVVALSHADAILEAVASR
jgi:uroporphyrin-III C-methyltransferase/precorrin-2 dehydrogenase/sirohydrochlorin ferrochelatase